MRRYLVVGLLLAVSVPAWSGSFKLSEMPGDSNPAPVNIQSGSSAEKATVFENQLLSMTHRVAVAKNLIAGASVLASNGLITASTGTNIPVTPSGLLNLPPDAGVQMSFVSTSAQDAVGGTGISTIAVQCLDASLNPVTEIVVLTGLTPKAGTITNCRWIQSMSAYMPNVLQYAAGNITASSGGTEYGRISTGSLVQESSFRMVPAGKLFFPDEIVLGSISSFSDTSSVLKLIFRAGGLWSTTSPLGIQNNSVYISLSTGRGLPAGTLFGCVHTTNKAATVSAVITGRLENVP